MEKIMLNLCAFVYILLFAGFTQANDVTYLFAHGLFNDRSLSTYYEAIRGPQELDITDSDMRMTFKSGAHHSWAIKDPAHAHLWIIQQPLHSFNFPDAIHGFDGSRTSLGQENEIARLAMAYEKIKDKKIVAMGMSRGASAILNFLGTRAPTSIAAAVVESPFDSITDILDSFCQSHWWIPTFVRHTAPNVLFGKFDRNGIFPIRIADKINTNIPILIIASLEDKLIPASNTASIYLKLLDCGHQNVYFLLLDKGAHAYLLEDENAHWYLNTVHAFYQKYNLPHNSALAAQGQALLAQCQPSKKVVEDALKAKKSFIKY